MGSGFGLAGVEGFRSDSLAGVYYAPFAINSKNWRHVPEETKEWFGEIGDLLKAGARLTEQGDHLHAVACFETLYESFSKQVYPSAIGVASEAQRAALEAEIERRQIRTSR